MALATTTYSVMNVLLKRTQEMLVGSCRVAKTEKKNSKWCTKNVAKLRYKASSDLT